MSTNGDEARRFTRGQRSGVLSTLSRRIEGYPFGSVSPFILDHAGRPVILISEIAEHTKNIEADPRVSMIVQPYSPDMQSTGRVTVIGQARRLPDKDGLGPRYLRYFPQAEAYFGMHDFNFYRVEPVKIRYIGGFGRIHWVEPENYLRADTEALVEAETAILDHMNSDHADTLMLYCQARLDLRVPEARMIGIDPDGFDLRVGDDIARIEFDAPVSDAASARQAFVALAQQCRG
jgi:putative heme iron utilization protein